MLAHVGSSVLQGHARTVKAGVGPVFAVERHSGTIEPHATRHISVSFFGRDVGQTTQFWTLRYTAQKVQQAPMLSPT